LLSKWRVYWLGRGRGAGGVGSVSPRQLSQRGGKLGDNTNILNNKKYFQQFYKFIITELESQLLIEVL